MTLIEKKFSWKYCMSLSGLNTALLLGLMVGMQILFQPFQLVPFFVFIITPPIAFTLLTLHMRYMWSYLTDEKPNRDEVKS